MDSARVTIQGHGQWPGSLTGAKANGQARNTARIQGQSQGQKPGPVARARPRSQGPGPGSPAAISASRRLSHQANAARLPSPG